MAYYLVQSSYTAEAWAALVKNPQNRMEMMQTVAESLGGRIIDGWVSFGEYDAVGICEMPDNVSMAAFSMAASAGGASKAVKTTPLMTMEEGIEAMKKAGEAAAAYKPPSG